jgi:hypothetical protein
MLTENAVEFCGTRVLLQLLNRLQSSERTRNDVKFVLGKALLREAELFPKWSDGRPAIGECDFPEADFWPFSVQPPDFRDRGRECFSVARPGTAAVRILSAAARSAIRPNPLLRASTPSSCN